MTGRRRIALLLMGCAVPAAAGLGYCSSAAAQNWRPTLTSDGLPRLKQEPELRRSPAVAPPAEPEPDLPDASAEPGQVADMDETDPTLEDPDAAPRPPRLRVHAVDGDLRGSFEPTAMSDGLDDTREPDSIEDGIDATRYDMRRPEDIAAFERPRAGFDPEPFQVEVEPILDRRPHRLFRFEPYDPLGIRIGGFVLLPAVEVGPVWQSNIFRSQHARADTALELRPSAWLISNWSTHALEFRATANTNFHRDFASEDDRAYLLEARGRLDITRRTNLVAAVSREVAQESRSLIDAARDADRADVTTDRVALAFNTRFNRLGLQLRSTFTDVDYSSTLSDTGARISNDDRDVRIAEEAARLSWQFKPALLAFAEVAVNQREHGAVSITDGISRDSNGERYRLGLGFGTTGQRVRGEVSVGYGHQRPEDGRLSDIDGIIFDANLAWRVDALNTILLTARSDVSETTLIGSSGALSRQVGIEGRHSFLRELIGTAGVFYTVDDYAGVALEERELKSAVTLEYYFSREAMTFARYQHVSFRSTDASRDYEADEVRFGFRFTR